MGSINSLQHFYIINCRSLKSFPEDYPPTDLKTLYIHNCKKLEFIKPAEKRDRYAFLENLCIGNSCDSLTSLSLYLFPKLRCLSIWDCANLESLSKPEGIQEHLTSLEALEIRDCPSLVYFPKEDCLPPTRRPFGYPIARISRTYLISCRPSKIFSPCF